MSQPDVGRSQPEHEPSFDSYSDWEGRVLDGRYRIDKLLGEGGMGAVFVGEHLRLMKKVAIKVIHPEFAGDGDVAERFAREAVAAGQMDHPHVASATDYGTLAEGGAYLVMQYVRGKSLRDTLDDEGALGWIKACEIGAQVADALAAAHQKGYVHRDLKPDNVMLEPRDDGSRLVKVLDFGIARVASEKAVGAGGRTLTRVGTVIGTPGYMAPEQALGETVDYRADLYALGLVLHEIITGKPVFDQTELTAIVTRQLTEGVPRIAQVTDGVPPELDELLASMLQRDKRSRPESAAEVREALRRLLLGATLQAVASGEHALPKLGTIELAGAAEREPTPLGVKVGTTGRSKAISAPAVATAPTVASPTARRPAVEEPPIEKIKAVAAARTAVALEQVKKQASKTGLPLPWIGAGCAALALVGLLSTVVLAVAFGGDDEPETPPETPEVVEPTGEPVPEPTPEPREQARRSAPEPTPSGTPTPSASANTIPPELAQSLADLLNSESDRSRRRAAREILDHQPREAVPAFLVAIAEIETTTNCRTRREHVIRLGELGDPRALPVLERLDATPRNTCGNIFRRVDCLGCMRDELTAAIGTLTARTQ